MNVRISPAKGKYADEIATILSGWVDETDWMPRVHTLEEDRGFGEFLIRKTDVTVAIDEGKVVGFLALQGCVVQALYIAKNARGFGIGARLLDRAKQGLPRLELWTFQANHKARQFYAREGFSEVLETDGNGNDEKLPDVKLAWERER